MKLATALVLLASLCLAAPSRAQAGSSATLTAWTPLPGIEGDFDFLTLDSKRNHVIIAAEVDTWTTPDLNLNTSMTLDSTTHRPFVVGHKPGIFYAFDAGTGKVVSQQPCTNIADGMAWDPASKLIYIFASQGMSIFHQDSADHYTLLPNLPTNGGKTGLLLPSSNRLFAVHPKTSIDDAGLLVYHVNR